MLIIRARSYRWHAQRAQETGVEGSRKQGRVRQSPVSAEHTTHGGDKTHRGRHCLCRGRVFGFIFRNYKTPHPAEGRKRRLLIHSLSFLWGQGPLW